MKTILKTLLITSLMTTSPLAESGRGVDGGGFYLDLGGTGNKSLLDLSNTPFDYGSGYDTFSKERRGDCLDHEGVHYAGGTNSNTNASTTFELKMIESSSELSRYMRIDAAASLKSMWGSGSAVANYIKKQEFSSYSIYVLVKSEVRSPFKEIKNPRLKAELLTLVEKKEAFRLKCGDHFLKSMQHGGSFFAILKLETSDRKVHEDIRAKVKAKVGTFKASADFAKALKSVTKERNFEILTTMVGGNFDTNVTSVEALMERSIHFPIKVGANPLPIGAKTLPYETVINFPVQTDRIGTAVQAGNLEILNNLYLQYKDLLDNIRYIKEHPEQFEEPNLAYLHNEQNRIFDEIIKIQVMAQKCFESYKKCKLEGTWELIDMKLPIRLPNISGSLLCKSREHKVCGHVYNTRVSKACPGETFKEGEGPICGPKGFRLDRTKACGVERYNSRAEAPCPTATRTEYQWVPERCRNPRLGAMCEVRRAVDITYHVACEHENFGPSLFYQCRHESHGEVNNWPTCRDESFGIETHQACEHPNHGILYTKTCKIREYLDNTTGERIVEKCE